MSDGGADRRRTNIARLDPSNYGGAMARLYATGDTPWDTGRPNPEILRVVEAGGLPGPTLLEFGCGTGTNAIELARRGYRVTAVDLVEIAVEKAREKARRAGVTVDLRQGDLTQLDLGGPYDALLDSGVYHGIRQRDLEGFHRVLERVTRPRTRWLSLAGNAREPSAHGPPVVTEAEIRRELEPLFRIVELREFRWDLRPDLQPLAWSILMERR
jgi:SAM-dependent methyltransferase